MRVVGLICGKVWLGSILLFYGAGIRLDAAQAKPKPAPPPKPAPKAAAPKQQANKQQAPKAVPADELEKMLNMSPEEREKNLSKYPPAQRQNLENRLTNLDKLSPEDRAQRLQRTRELEKLPLVGGRP